jgi:hypothetical protein
VVYTTMTFLWAMVILVGGATSEADASTASDVTDAASLLPH